MPLAWADLAASGRPLLPPDRLHTVGWAGGAIPAALAEHGPDLLAQDPDIKLVELIAVKQA